MGALVERWEDFSIREQLKYQRSPSECEAIVSVDLFRMPAKATFRENECGPNGLQIQNYQLRRYRIA
jgi:hypothetical protein